MNTHLQGVAETDDVGGCGDGVGQREHEPDGAAELRPKGAGDHVVNATWEEAVGIIQ